MKNDIKQLIDLILPEILGELNAEGLQPSEISYDIEIPKAKEHGDVSVNAAFQLAKKLKRNPFDIAKILQKHVEKRVQSDSKWQKQIVRAQAVRPGFVNFFMAGASIAGRLLEIARADLKYGASDFGKGKKVIIEFVSANPTGPLTIAHGRQAAIGDSLARIMSTVGYSVHKEFYLNDAGRQIRLLGESLFARYQELHGIESSVPQDGYQGAYLIESARRLKEAEGDKLLRLDRAEALKIATRHAVRDNMASIEKDLKDVDVSFDEYFSEKTLYDKNLVEKAIESLKKQGCVYDADGALWFRSTQFGDDKDRVLKKQTGEYTYLAPDIAYHAWKFNRGYELLINLWGPDHHGYVTRLKAACQALGHTADQIKILLVQLTTLYRNGDPVRMSTRAGEFVSLRELVNEVGADAARFFFLVRKVESHLDFDLELAKKKSDDNPVFYLQYAHARICSILKYAERGSGDASDLMGADLALIQAQEEQDLIKKMVEYPEALAQSAQNFEPYRIVDYLRELAALFHRFYTVHRVVTENEALTESRLLICHCVRLVLRNGLAVLGVSAPEKM